jgi:hypothetical protein
VNDAWITVEGKGKLLVRVIATRVYRYLELDQRLRSRARVI